MLASLEIIYVRQLMLEFELNTWTCCHYISFGDDNFNENFYNNA